jgi:hypothetical protein
MQAPQLSRKPVGQRSWMGVAIGVVVVVALGALVFSIEQPWARGTTSSPVGMADTLPQADRTSQIEHLRGSYSTGRERAVVTAGSAGVDRADAVARLRDAPQVTTAAPSLDRADTIARLHDAQRAHAPLYGVDRADAIEQLTRGSLR